MGSISLSLSKDNSAPRSSLWKAPEKPGVTVGHGILNDFLQQVPALPKSAPWVPAFLKELQNEKDEDFLLTGLLQIGVRLKTEHQVDAAQVLLHRLTQQDIPAEVRSKAQAEAAAMGESGPSGLRAEYLLSRVWKDSSNERVIATMVGATFAGQAVSALTLGRLGGMASRGVGSWMTRGAGIELTAGTAAFLAEASTFAVLGRALSPIPNGPLADDLFRSGLTLGALRIFSKAGNAGSKLLAPARALQGAPIPMVSQASAFLGLMAARKLEEHFQLRSAVEGATFYLDTFASLVNLGIGANLGRRITGEGIARFQAEMAIRAKQNSSVESTLNGPQATQYQWAAQMIGKGRSVPPKNSPIVPMSMMSMMGPGGKKGLGGKNQGPDSIPPSDGTIYRPAEEVPEILEDAELVDIAEPRAIVRVPSPGIEMQEPPPPAPDPYVGTTIDGKLRVEEVLGQGGMGVVYRCTHAILGKKVAIKVLRQDLSRDREAIRRFYLEAKAVQEIKNSHIIEIYDFGQLPDGSTYFVMEYLDGVPLSKLVEGGNPAPMALILPIARQLAEGLAAAHRETPEHPKGIVHRDLKPDNIFLVTREGNERDWVKILDFGIAKVSSSNAESKLTLDGQVFGTPHYMSPEQSMASEVDRRGDIYSYGVILYELATGKVPFDGPNFMGIMTQHQVAKPKPIRSLVAKPEEVPLGFEAIVLKCLSKRPGQRYQSMEEVLADLEKLEGGRVPKALPEMKSRENRRFLPLLVGLGAVGSAALVAGALFLSNRPGVKTEPLAPPPTQPTQAPVPEVKPIPPQATPKKEVELVILPKEASDAHVWLRDEDLGPSPVMVPIEGDAPVKVEIRRKGFKSQTIELDGSKDTQTIRLERDTSNQRRVPKPPTSSSQLKQPQPAPKSSSPTGMPINPWK